MKRTIVLSLVVAMVSTMALGSVTRARYLMGTICEITVPEAADAEGQINAAFEEGQRVESMLSTWRTDTELSRLNQARTMSVSPELWGLLSEVMRWNEITEGTFNPLIAPLIDAWKTRQEGALPDAATLVEAMKRVKTTNLGYGSNHTIFLTNGARLEEGGFGKGYAIDCMLRKLPSQAVINLGGQIGLRGQAKVTIADPQHRDRSVLTFPIEGAGIRSLSTSSGSERTFEVGGQRFSHIFDPRTGEALSPRGSASVLANSALLADMLSTALYVMGAEEGLRWANQMGVAALFILPDHTIRVSEQFRHAAKQLEVLDHHFILKE
jgi:thiamine biosynthesis lipoprotein